MSLKMSQGEGVTVITFSSNSNSKWPILCQILGTLCNSPLCAVSQHMKAKMTGVHTALGIEQILVGILYIVAESVFVRFTSNKVIVDAPFWFGGVFIVVGIVSVPAAQFPSTFHLLGAVVLNIFSTFLAVIGLALHSCDLSVVLDSKEMIREAMDVIMMICSALQIGLTLSFAVLTVKLFDTNSVEDPHIYKPLKEDVTVSHVC
ncbi:uncharacterized protein LOC125265791 [Megalobrama amblycephala]|uniref:uncharacterized protein LOC125265791 n=1 Tax=Megalobrama amblycephala TaxID=75352 RepID=UPI0020146576|nr:uncharacterized protein LOC125265791 [Megalobrama amblycephala]